MNELVKDNDVVSVVIVEDYKLTRVGLKSTLNEYKHINVVGEAEDATIGISMIERLKPDVVLMDLGLPGMNGLEATMKIKEMGLKSKVIILTSHERSEEVIAALGSGANAYCLKIFRLKHYLKLLKMFQKVLVGLILVFLLLL